MCYGDVRSSMHLGRCFWCNVCDVGKKFLVRMCTHCMGSCRCLSVPVVKSVVIRLHGNMFPSDPCVCKWPCQGNRGFSSTRAEGPFHSPSSQVPSYVLWAIWPNSEQFFGLLRVPPYVQKQWLISAMRADPFFCLLSFCRLCNHRVLLCT